MGASVATVQTQGHGSMALATMSWEYGIPEKIVQDCQLFCLAMYP